MSEADSIENIGYRSPRYTHLYRWTKSALLLLTWISFGLNFELIGITLEDLKIFLSVDYKRISLGPVLRNIGYLSLTLPLGLVLDRISSYLDLLMAAASGVIALTNFLMPVTRSFMLSMSYFLLQGFAQSVYDLTGISIIISLWKNIKGSPINLLQGGYGIGACIATILVKPFVTFDPLIMKSQENFFISSTKLNDTLNSSIHLLTKETNFSVILPENIRLKQPYWIAATLPALLCGLFLIAHQIEVLVNKSNETNRRNYILLMVDTDEENESLDTENHTDDGQKKESKALKVVMELLFSDKKYTGSSLAYNLGQILLFICLFVFTQGAFTITTRFMFTYLLRSPVKFTSDSFALIETFLWFCIILSRFTAAIILTDLSSMKFLMSILFGSTLTSAMLLIPILSHERIIIWILVPLLGVFSGPVMPCCLMVAKNILQFNSFVLSMFIVGMGLGGIIFQELCAVLLDRISPKFTNPVNVIPFLTFISSFASFAIFLLIFFFKNRFNHLKN